MKIPTRKHGRRQLVMSKISCVMKQRGQTARGRDLLRSAQKSIRTGHESMARSELEEFLQSVEDLSIDHHTLLGSALNNLGWQRLRLPSWLSKVIEWIVQTVVTTVLKHGIPSLNSYPLLSRHAGHRLRSISQRTADC